jgi:phosphoribosylformimino-5-aminoimidazole carboxamide ribotide isomerase
MNFRPCIDLHAGVVKQIVGSTLRDDNPDAVTTNFVAEKSSGWFARLYRADNLKGGHIIKLGPGNDAAAEEALGAWPGGMQIGGSITATSAPEWLDKGASHVIVTSFVFNDGRIDMSRLQELVCAVGKERIVLDLSCRRRGGDYFIVTDRWQKFTKVVISEQVLSELAVFCSEFLVHAADVEGKCRGVELELIDLLGRWTPIPTTYAGGVRDLADLELIKTIGRDRLDVTAGSSLDIFGGDGLLYRDAVDYCRQPG